MRPPAPKPPEPTAKIWLVTLAVVAVVFLVATVYSLVRTIQDTRSPRREVTLDAPALAPSREGVVWGDGQTSTAGRIKVLEMPVQPIQPKTPEGVVVSKTPEDIQKDIVRDQAAAQLDLIRKYPKSPFALTPHEIEEMQRKGITLN